METPEIKDIFLKNVCPCLDFQVHEVEHCEEVTQWGKANFIWKVVCKTERGQETFFIKHARAQIRRSDVPEEIRNVFLDPARCFSESDFLHYLEGLWGTGVVPKVLYTNRDEFYFVMTDVSRGSPLLVEEFGAFRAHPETAPFVGKCFGLLHRETFGSDIDFCASDLWRERMTAFYNEYWLSIGVRAVLGDEIVDEFYHVFTDEHSCVMWGDPVYRNIFTHPDNAVSFVDFDHTFRYDPAVDNGMLLAHWIWMMAHPTNEQIRADARKFIEGYWPAYLAEVGRLGSDEENRIFERSIRWAGVYLLSRTNGRSGSYFKDTPEWEAAVRDTGKDLFTTQTGEVARVLSACHRASS